MPLEVGTGGTGFQPVQQERGLPRNRIVEVFRLEAGTTQNRLEAGSTQIYPTGKEASSLVGWRVCSNLDGVPDEFVKSRRVKTTVGTILVLVCNDAAIFSARSRSNLGSKLGLAIREHFLKQASITPAPHYLLMATHWQGINPDTGRWSGEAFRQAADFLANETGATVVTTMRAPKSELVAAANRFRIVGSREDKVVTLLVCDTL